MCAIITPLTMLEPALIDSQQKGAAIVMNLNQVTLPALDVAASVAFYQGLGFRLIVDTPHYARFECPEGDATFSVHGVEKVVESTGVVVYFETAELDRRVEELIRSGYEFDLSPTDQRWLWREARLRDPSNNVICFYFAGENRKNPPWRVDPDA